MLIQVLEVVDQQGHGVLLHIIHAVQVADDLHLAEAGDVVLICKPLDNSVVEIPLLTCQFVDDGSQPDGLTIMLNLGKLPPRLIIGFWNFDLFWFQGNGL